MHLANDLKDILLIQLLLGPEAPTELVYDIVRVWGVDLKRNEQCLLYESYDQLLFVLHTHSSTTTNLFDVEVVHLLSPMVED